MVARRIAIFSLVVFAFALVAPSPTLACSGGGPPWSERLPGLIQYNDVVVIGEFERLDDAQANGIFHVQMYLNGSGPEYLVIQASDLRAVENQLHVGRNYSMCGLYSPVHLNTIGTYIYFLDRQRDGIYHIGHTRYFESPDTPTFVWRTPDGETIELNVGELAAQITAAVEHDPQVPDTAALYPRVTPILLTTVDDRHFILPVDTDTPVPVSDEELTDLRRDQSECSSPPCTVYSPNGLDKVYLRPEEGEPHSLEWLVPYVESNAFGQRIVFSATSDTYALWHDDQIQVFVLWYPALGYPDERIASASEIVVINTTPAGNSLDYPVAWSPDGRALAFSTDEGLWLWDALTNDYPPQLLIPAGVDIPVARYFSPQGRYLAITDGDRRYNLDLMTRREMPDGYISPDDRTLLVFDTATTVPTTLEVMYLAPGIRRTEYYPEVQYRKVQWIDNVYFGASITGFGRLEYVSSGPYESPSGELYYEGIPQVVEETFYDVVRYHSSGIPYIAHELMVPYAVRTPFMDDLTYNDGPGLIEMNVGGYEIRVNGWLFSFDTVLPSPIKDAVWLPSAFYFEHD